EGVGAFRRGKRPAPRAGISALYRAWTSGCQARWGRAGRVRGPRRPWLGDRCRRPLRPRAAHVGRAGWPARGAVAAVESAVLVLRRGCAPARARRGGGGHSRDPLLARVARGAATRSVPGALARADRWLS